jgi:hypothetical protein
LQWEYGSVRLRTSAATQSNAAAAVTTPKQRQTTRTESEPARRQGRRGEAAGPEPDGSGAPFAIVCWVNRIESREYRIGMDAGALLMGENPHRYQPTP